MCPQEAGRRGWELGVFSFRSGFGLPFAGFCRIPHTPAGGVGPSHMPQVDGEAGMPGRAGSHPVHMGAKWKRREFSMQR